MGLDAKGVFPVFHRADAVADRKPRAGVLGGMADPCKRWRLLHESVTGENRTELSLSVVDGHARS
jgi:hypothetical protein